MANIKITIESNWDHLTKEQQDHLCRIYSQTLIKFLYDKKVKEKRPEKIT